MLVVVGLIVVGLTAAVISVSYWNARTAAPLVKRPDSKPKAADEALEKLQDYYGHARQKKLYDAIIDRAREQVDRFPEHAPSHNFLALALSEAGHLQEAFDRVKLSLELDKGQAQMQFTAGVLATKLDKLKPALAHYGQAVSLGGDKPIYRVHLAMVHIELQRYDRARMLLLQAVRQDSNLEDAHFGLSQLYFVQNNLSLALEQIDKAIRRTPISKRDKQIKYIRHKSAILRRHNRWMDALAVLEALTDEERLDAAVMEEMAVSWLNVGRPEEGALLYERALALNPASLTCAAGAARWRIQAGDLDTAQRHIARAREINPRAKQVAQIQEKLDRTGAEADATAAAGVVDEGGGE